MLQLKASSYEFQIILCIGHSIVGLMAQIQPTSVEATDLARWLHGWSKVQTNAVANAQHAKYDSSRGIASSQ